MSEKINIDLSIIILSYRSKEYLKVLLPSVFASEGIEFYDVIPVTQSPPNIGGVAKGRGDIKYTAEVIVVDNGSNDGTYEWLQTINYKLHIIQNTNNGFAAGNNIGIKKSAGRYILLLNPDTKLEPNTLAVMLDFMETCPEVGISGCKLIKPDGKLDLACRRRFPNPWNSFRRLFLNNNQNYNYTDIDEDKEMEVDSIVGAFMLVRRSAMEKFGLLDESFFMYGEDLDWCWRCKEAGFKVWYYPKAFITHYKGESSKKIPLRALKWFHDAMWIFYRKHYRSRYPFFFNWFVWLGIYGRMTVLILINMLKKNRVVSK